MSWVKEKKVIGYLWDEEMVNFNNAITMDGIIGWSDSSFFLSFCYLHFFLNKIYRPSKHCWRIIYFFKICRCKRTEPNAQYLIFRRRRFMIEMRQEIPGFTHNCFILKSSFRIIRIRWREKRCPWNVPKHNSPLLNEWRSIHATNI